MSRARPRVGVLGGTFDPPHCGHLGVVRVALESGRVDEVWLVPCLRHAFGKQPAPFPHRLEMCRLLIGGEPRARVSDVEAELDRPGRTLELVRLLAERHPGIELRLLAGSDIYHEREKWHRYDEIAALAPPLYVERRGVETIPEPVLEAPPRVSSTELRRLLAEGRRPLELAPAAVLDYALDSGLYGGEA